MKLSVIIPVYNEAEGIHVIIKRVQDQELPEEILVVDDSSKDGTRDLLKDLDGKDGVRVILHEHNQGKGYDPHDYTTLIELIKENIADVVYGSRFFGASHHVAVFWHMIANRMLTFMTNILYNTILTDMETGYKGFRREILNGMVLHANSFIFEPSLRKRYLDGNSVFLKCQFHLTRVITQKKKRSSYKCVGCAG